MLMIAGYRSIPGPLNPLIATVRYTYQVNGEHLEARTIGYRGVWAGTVSELERIRRTYRRGHRVTVWYDPDTPSRAVLEPGPGNSSFIRVALSGIVLCAGIALIQVGLRAA